MAPVLQEVLAANESYAASFGDKGKLAMPPARRFAILTCMALGQKIEAVEGIVPVRLSLVARCAAIGLMQLRIADLPIFVLGCCELHSQKQAQLKVGAFEPQPSVYQN
jgi:hypothetical protein